MKTLTKKEALQAILEGKEVTSDEFDKPDEWYVFYSPQGTPFQLNKDNNIYTFFNWDIKTWRLRRYVPKDKELIFCWDIRYKAFTGIGYYDEKYKGVYDITGGRDGGGYDNYAPYKGELPPNMCTVEELEE